MPAVESLFASGGGVVKRSLDKVCSHKTGFPFKSLEITTAFKLISLSLHLAFAKNIWSCKKTSDPV